MDLKSIKAKIVKVYLDNAFQFNISRELGRVLASHDWKHKDEVFAEYDAKNDRVIISRKFLDTPRGWSDTLGIFDTFYNEMDTQLTV